jgi:hypothetical protein
LAGSEEAQAEGGATQAGCVAKPAGFEPTTDHKTGSADPGSGGKGAVTPKPLDVPVSRMEKTRRNSDIGDAAMQVHNRKGIVS